MSDLEEISRQRKSAHEKLMSLNSRTYKAFLEMEKVTFSEGNLSRKIKELIAVGVSVVIDCESCDQGFGLPRLHHLYQGFAGFSVT